LEVQLTPFVRADGWSSNRTGYVRSWHIASIREVFDIAAIEEKPHHHGGTAKE
jgi:hypothetical protein